jgi:hypothetical protein
LGDQISGRSGEREVLRKAANIDTSAVIGTGWDRVEDCSGKRNYVRMGLGVREKMVIRRRAVFMRRLVIEESEWDGL